MTTLRQDFLYTVRTLRKSPAFAAIAVLTLALGIGANTALFSVVNGVLLNPLPYPHSDRLAAVYARTPGVDRGPVVYLNFLDWQRTSRAEAERLTGYMISADSSRPWASLPFSAAPSSPTTTRSAPYSWHAISPPDGRSGSTPPPSAPNSCPARKLTVEAQRRRGTHETIPSPPTRKPRSSVIAATQCESPPQSRKDAEKPIDDLGGKPKFEPSTLGALGHLCALPVFCLMCFSAARRLSGQCLSMKSRRETHKRSWR